LSSRGTLHNRYARQGWSGCAQRTNRRSVVDLRDDEVVLPPEQLRRLKAHVSDAVLSCAYRHWFRDSVMTEESSISAASSSSTSGLQTVRQESKRRPCRSQQRALYDQVGLGGASPQDSQLTFRVADDPPGGARRRFQQCDLWTTTSFINQQGVTILRSKHSAAILL
jgi:hypothetical protein